MIVSLVTLYYPDLQVIDNIKSIYLQSDIVYLLDNSPANNEKMFCSFDNVVYKFFGKNLGLSAAFNEVLKKEEFNDDDFIIFFDQDSHIQENHISLLIGEYQKLESNGFKIGCLGPEYYNTSSGKIELPKQKHHISETSYSVKSVITSSMLCKYRILKSVDFWNEKVFLDMADWDLCWRLIATKKLCFMTKVVILHHSLGCGEKKILFLRVKEGNPIREYYQTRDCMSLITKNYVPLKFRIRFFLMLTIRPLEHIIFLGDKKKRLYYYLKGIRVFLEVFTIVCKK